MNAERMQILKMLQEGKLTVDEAAQLIEALQHRAEKTVALTVENQPREASQSRASTGAWSLKNVFASNVGNARFENTQLDGAHVWFCSLDGANLRDADLTDAWVLGINLNNTNLEGANLRNTKLVGSNLDRADFTGADLSGSTIIGVNFDHGDFRGADLSGRVLIGLDMSRQQQLQSIVSNPVKE
jgi:uncharacterized protein YjbI with pentapeptide repeats